MIIELVLRENINKLLDVWLCEYFLDSASKQNLKKNQILYETA